MGIVIIGAVFVDIKGHPKSAYIPAGRNVGNVVQVYGGVTAEGWVKDAVGWRYRDSKGAFLAGQSVTLGSSVYTFSDEGYLIA